MNCRQQAIAAAVSVLLSASLSSHANTAEQATSHQPAQTQEAVIATSKEGVSDAIKQVEGSAANYVRAQKKHYRQQGREAEILIASGTALVSQPGTSPDWGDARVIAYQQAQTKARESLLKELYADVSSEIIRESFRTNESPEFAAEELQSQNALESLLGKVTAYGNAVLDSKLKEYGVDPKEYDAAPLEKRKIMMKQAFTKGTQTRSYGELSGAIIAQTFEITDTNGNTAVAVVLKTSVKMKNLLSSLRTSKGVVTPGKPGVNIADYLENNQANLMFEYGLRYFRDEEGYPVLLSFSQAGNACNPADYEECADNRSFAYDEAYNDAMSHFSEAYNLNGFTETKAFKGQQRIREEKITRSKGGGQETSQETISAILRETSTLSKMKSEVKGLVGIHEAIRWSELHPLTGREINGVVLAWRPKREQALRTFKANKVPPEQASQKRKKSSDDNSASSRFIMDNSDF